MSDLSIKELEMARRFFGYGSWSAPYWFIGPEQGRGPGEREDHKNRVDAWVALGKPEVCDCRDYHARINETRWHNDPPPLQPTWRSLIIVLMTMLNRPSSNVSLRDYQRERWGASADAETCVVELSGLAATSLSVTMDRGRFLHERVETIRKRIDDCRPKFVLMYGVGSQANWEEIAGCGLEVDGAVRSNQTVFAFAPHPVAFGRKRLDWIRLGGVCGKVLAETTRD